MSQPYFQFPLCALSFPDTDFQKLDHIIGYCCVEVGKLEWKKLSDGQKEGFRSSPPAEWQKPRVDLYRDSHLQTLLGAKRLNVVIYDVSGTNAQHTRLGQHVAAFERQYGPDVRVRLKANYGWDARDNKGLTFQELAVLSAIYSKIGASKSPVRITRDEILWRAHGCKTKRIFLQKIGLVTPPIRTRKVRSLIESLHERKFFARLTYARRQTFYSHRLNLDQLKQAVIRKKTRRAAARHARIEANNQLTEAIRVVRRNLAGAAPDDSRSEAGATATSSATYIETLK